MPITPSAKKALRKDKRRTADNRRVRTAIKTAVKLMVTEPSAKHLTSTYQVLDRAAKKHVIHDNKAARLKSRLSKLTIKKAKTRVLKTRTKRASKQ